MTNILTHRGWKAIAKRLGLSDLKATRRHVKKYKIPVVMMNRNPVLDEAVYRVWYQKYYEVSCDIELVAKTPEKHRPTPQQTPKQALSK